MSKQADPPIPAPFLAELSHELRTPLSAIIGFSDAMRAQAFGPLDDQYAEHAGLIHAAGRHMLALIEAMTGAAGPPRPPALFDLRETVREASGMVPADGAAVTLDLPPAPVMVRADALAVRQILINLIANAVRAAGAGGRVVLSAGREGAQAVLRVADDGPGLPQADAPASGRGLGLALSRGLAAAQGGELALANAAGAGVTATVRLPVAET